MRDIGKNIRDLRQQKAMTQDTLAEKLFVTRQTVSNYETGRTRPDVEMVMKIADVLGTDANTILYGIPTPPEQKAEIRKLCYAAAALLILLPLHIWLGDITDWYYYNMYVVWPRLLLIIFLTPAVFLLLGWSMMQAVAVFSKLTPITGTAARRIRLSIFLFSVIYLVVLLPFLMSLWIPLKLPQIWIRMGFALIGALSGSLRILDRSVLFFLCGILLWLFPHPKEKS